MFKRIMERLSGKSTPQASADKASAAMQDQELIIVYDSYGRELQITRADWREKMFMPNLQASWNDPDKLYSLILNGIDDGMVEEVKGASARLLTIDPIVERSGTMRAIVMLKLGRLDDAEAVLRETMQKVGQTGTLLTNLAKVEFERGEHEKAEATLWRAIEGEPNLDNGLMWWASIQRERGGDDAYVAALQRVAALPGSWRAQLWLARHHLQNGDVDTARALYQQALASDALDGEPLMMVSGDLGNHGQVPLMVELIAPVLNLQRHDPRAGLNLLQAYVQLGRLDEGEALLSQLYALNVAPLKQHLDRFSAELQQQRVAGATPTPVEEQALDIVSVPFDRPIWTYGLRDPQWLLSPKQAQAKKVLFLSLGKKVSEVTSAQQEREDEIGRMSRALPLYLAESVHFWTGYEGVAVMPVVRGGGPVLFQDTDDHAATVDLFKSRGDFIVLGSIDDRDERWRVECRVWSVAQNEWIAREQFDVPAAELAQGVLALEQRLLAALGGSAPTPQEAWYVRPSAEAMPPYLTGLGQSLMLSLAANELIPSKSLWGERNMLEWWLRLALHWEPWVVPRMAYLAALSTASGYGSPLLEEFRTRTLEFVRSAAGRDTTMARLAPVAWKTFGVTDELDGARRAAMPDSAYAQWLDRLMQGT